jgi:hypothetical protein
VVVVGIHIAEEHRRPVDGAYDDIDLAVVEEIAKGRAATRNHIREAGPGHGRNVFEFAIFEIVEQQRPLRIAGAPVMIARVWIDMAVDLEDIQPSIVVVVDKSGAPAQEREACLGKAGAITYIGKAGVAVVVVEHLVVVRKVGVEDIELAVVVVISHGQPHRSYFASVLVDGKARIVTGVLKSPVALVDIEIVRRRVVGHQQIRLAVVVDVHKDRGKSVVFTGVADAGLQADVGKCSVGVLVEEMIGLALQAARAAHAGLAAKPALRISHRLAAAEGQMVAIEVNVAGDE